MKPQGSPALVEGFNPPTTTAATGVYFRLDGRVLVTL